MTIGSNDTTITTGFSLFLASGAPTVRAVRAKLVEAGRPKLNV